MPLYRAADNGHIEAVKLLLEKGAGLTTPNSYSSMPLNKAGLKGSS